MMTVTTETGYEAVIGLEVHVQLLTKSKMFCACRAGYQGAEPNSEVCPVCLGMPGVLPVINKRAVEFVMMTGLALNCGIAEETKFDRKNYPYPDLMKGYQISQYDRPIASDGWMSIPVDGGEKSVRINRVHLEEDVAKLFHRTGETGEAYSLLDVNRAGVPLMEIVGEPDLRSAEEARQYLVKLRTILRYLGVSTANMEEGSFRCDANISIRPQGSVEFGAKVEVKNMNSFRSVFRALQFELERQAVVLEEGSQIAQETRGWLEDRGETASQRSKEHAHDYRYFPEPDLAPLKISRQWVDEVRAKMPELPDARLRRYVDELRLSEYKAGQLTLGTSAASSYFDSAMSYAGDMSETARRKRADVLCNLVLGDATRLFNSIGQEVSGDKLDAKHLFEVAAMLEEGKLSTNMASEVLDALFESPEKAPADIVKERGLEQISDSSAIQAAADRAIDENPKAVQDYMSGKETAVKFLVGQVMKATRGQANPALANEVLQQKLESLKEG